MYETMRSGPGPAFERYFTDATVEAVGLTELSDGVREMLENLGVRYLDPDMYDPRAFYDVRRVTLGNGDEIFVASRTKSYRDAGTEESTYVIDTRDGGILGFGEIRWRLTQVTGYFRDKPFVGFTETRRPHRRTGLAERRVRVMNALARQKYGLPINSDTCISDDARKLWEKLVSEGMARKYKEGAHDRYVYDDGTR